MTAFVSTTKNLAKQRLSFQYVSIFGTLSLRAAFKKKVLSELLKILHFCLGVYLPNLVSTYSVVEVM